MDAIPAPRAGRLGLRRPAALLARLGDERLANLVRRGDHEAFAVLYRRHLPGLLAFARQLLGSRDEAEDAVQQTMLAAYRELDQGERELRVRPWLYASTRNRCVSIMRSRREQPLEHAPEPSVAGLSEQVQRSEELRELLGDLARLPLDQRAALVLAELGQLSHAEIASVVDCPREKVKSLIFQARSTLIAARAGREADCASIRERLATAKGASLRRRELREHLRGCEGCREFRDHVRSQRAALALVLPVVPSIALRDGLLASLGIGGAAAAAAGGGGAAAGTAASGLAIKAAAVAAATGVVVGGIAISDATRERDGMAETANEAKSQASDQPGRSDARESGGGKGDASGAGRRGDRASGSGRGHDHGRRDRARGAHADNGARGGNAHAGSPNPAAPSAPAPPGPPAATPASPSGRGQGAVQGRERSSEVSGGAQGEAQSGGRSSNAPDASGSPGNSGSAPGPSARGKDAGGGRPASPPRGANGGASAREGDNPAGRTRGAKGLSRSRL